MSILKSNKKENVIINPNQSSNVITLCAGVDAGSTQTRVVLADHEDYAIISDDSRVEEATTTLNNIFIIPSSFSFYGNAEVLPKSQDLKDNFDSTIVRTKVPTESPMISHHRVLRGQKVKDAPNSCPLFLDSTTAKSDNQVFYINILDALGYALLQKYSGRIPRSVNVHLGLSVRPQELGSIFTKKLISNLKGEFSFVWGDVKIDLNILDIELSTEPEAQILGSNIMYTLIGDTETSSQLEQLSDFIHIEGGGSSIGVEVAKTDDEGNIKLLGGCSATFSLGGEYLKRILKSVIRNNRGINASDDNIMAALNSGLLRNGTEQLDIKAELISAKQLVAKDIVESFRHEVIDQTRGFSLNDYPTITLAGRLFERGSCDVPMSTYISKEFKQISPNTEIIALPSNYIPVGNLISLLQGGALDDGGEQEES